MTGSGLADFLVRHRCKLARLTPNSHFLTRFPHPTDALKQTTQFSFSLTLVHAHAHTHTRSNVLGPVPAGDLTLTVPRVSQMAAEPNSSRQQGRVNA